MIEEKKTETSSVRVGDLAECTNVWTKDPYDAVLKKNGGKFPSRLTMSRR